MHVASLELSKQLWELSGWTLPELSSYWWMKGFTDKGKTWNCRQVEDGAEIGSYDVPAYDLGYLVRKLKHYHLTSSNGETRCWYDSCSEIGDTPEDAACKLAIELIRRGAIKR